MDTFDSAETSQARSRPIILYTIVTSGPTYRHTTSAMEVMFDGHTFTPLTIAHDDEQISPDPSSDELVIHLPISHPFVQRYAAAGIPDQSVRVLVQELQSSTSTAALSWSGAGQSLSVTGHMAALRVPTSTGDALRIQLPVLSASKICNRVLFDAGCAPNPGGDFGGRGPTSGGPTQTAFQITATLDSISAGGTEMVFRFLGGLPDDWFTFGKVSATIFDARFTGELQTRSVISHVGLTITVDASFVATGDQLLASVFTVEAGCAHDVFTCVNKFANRTNFGGQPQMTPAIDPWSRSGVGIIQQV